MKLSNFVKTKIIQNGPMEITHHGEVDATVATGVWKWKKETTQRHAIARKIPGSWFFVETGEYCPMDQIDALERAFLAKNQS